MKKNHVNIASFSLVLVLIRNPIWKELGSVIYFLGSQEAEKGLTFSHRGNALNKKDKYC